MPEYLNSRPSKLGDYRLPREVDVIGDGKEGEKKGVGTRLPPSRAISSPPAPPSCTCHKLWNKLSFLIYQKQSFQV